MLNHLQYSTKQHYIKLNRLSRLILYLKKAQTAEFKMKMNNKQNLSI